jgi:hypothetical protein
VVILLVVGGALFLEIMIPSLLISLFPGTVVRLLEACRCFKRGTLSVGTMTYVAGGGYHRTGRAYSYHAPDGRKRTANARVFGWLLLLCLPVVIVAAIVVASLVR